MNLFVFTATLGDGDRRELLLKRAIYFCNYNKNNLDPKAAQLSHSVM